MKKLVLEVSLRIARGAEMAINDNPFISENGSWKSSDTWESINFNTDDEEDNENYDALRTSIEEQMRIAGLSEFELNEHEN